MSKIDFHFRGGVADNHQLPVDFMINLLNNIRDLAYLIVAQSQGQSFNERFNPSRKIRNDYLIKCDLPRVNGFAQQISIDYVGQEELLLNPVDPADNIQKLLDYAVNADEPRLIELFPTAKVRAKALSYVREAFPRPDSSIYVTIPANDNSQEIDTRIVQKNITSIIDKTQSEVEEYMTVVTGRLSRIDFDEKKIVIVYPVNHRELECFYDESIEDMLIENRRDLVQVTGKVVFDDDEKPKKITDVVNIQEVDLSPIELDNIQYGDNNRLNLRNRLVLTPTMDDTEQLYTISYPELGIEMFAYTRQELTDDVKSEIVYLWDEYARADNTELTADAIILKNNLLAAIEEA